MKRVVFFLLLAGCDDLLGANKEAIEAVKPRISGGPVSACCGPDSHKGCAEDAETRCACVKNATITSTKAEPLGYGGERTRKVTFTIAGPNGKGTCHYQYGYGMLGGGDCTCESADAGK